MEAEKYQLHTIEEYFEAEEQSEVRHEYLAGTVHAMAGGTRRHNEIAGQLYRLLHSKLGKGPCRTYMSDVKVRVQTMAGDFFYYPDVMVGCDPSDRHAHYLERPSILCEVTSPSTEATDRREKLLAYQTLPSLEHYVIVSQDEPSIDWFRRTANGWERVRLADADDRLEFPSVGASMSVSEIYDGIG
ncbi:MAG TPA: Uma2 family endonuclease [Bacteroidia bacterium]|nr:Uma2 family endonuclease [Bacteroidia bacterium]